MKICFWTTSIFELGGIKRVTTILANELVKEHDVSIVTFEKRSQENRAMYGLSQQIKVEFARGKDLKDNRSNPARYARSVLRHLNDKTGIFDHPGQEEFLRNIFYPTRVRNAWITYFNKKKYDVIIATAGLSMNLAVMADQLNAQTIGWQHNRYDVYVNQKNKLFWKKESLIRKYFPKLDHYVVLNDFDKAEYKEKQGIDCVSMCNPRSVVSEKKAALNEKNFFVAARLSEAKGFDLLMDSFYQFCQQDDEWKLVIAGDGELREEIIDLVWQYGLQERVVFTGMTNQVEKYYLNSSIYLMPSKWEGWGLVVIEAFEMGLPVIAYDIVPMDVLITNGYDGIIVEKFDAGKYAAAMLELAHNDELRKEMGKRAVETARKFSAPKIAQLWIDMINGN